MKTQHLLREVLLALSYVERFGYKFFMLWFLGLSASFTWGKGLFDNHFQPPCLLVLSPPPHIESFDEIMKKIKQYTHIKNLFKKIISHTLLRWEGTVISKQ